MTTFGIRCQREGQEATCSVIRDAVCASACGPDSHHSKGRIRHSFATKISFGGGSRSRCSLCRAKQDERHSALFTSRMFVMGLVCTAPADWKSMEIRFSVLLHILCFVVASCKVETRPSFIAKKKCCAVIEGGLRAETLGQQVFMGHVSVMEMLPTCHLLVKASVSAIIAFSIHDQLLLLILGSLLNTGLGATILTGSRSG